MTNSNDTSSWVAYTAAADFWGDSTHSQLSIRKNTRFLVDIRQHGQPGWLWGTTGDKTGWVPEWAAEVALDEKRKRRSRDRINPMLNRISQKHPSTDDLSMRQRRSRRHSTTDMRDVSWRIKLDSMESLTQCTTSRDRSGGKRHSYNLRRTAYKSNEAVNRLADITGLKMPSKSTRSNRSISTDSLTSRTSSRRSTGNVRDSSRRSSSNKKNSTFDLSTEDNKNNNKNKSSSPVKKSLFAGKLSKMTKRLSSQSGLNLVGSPSA